MKRILIVNFPSGMGGTERYVKNLFDSLDKEKYILDILYYHGIDSYYEEYFLNRGARLYEIPYYVKNPIQFLRCIFRFYKKHPEYDIIYCQANHASAMLYTLPIWLDRKRHILFHSHNSNSTHLMLHKILSKIVTKKCEYLFACSNVAAKYMYGKASERAILINNGVNISEYRYNEKVRNDMREIYHIGDELVIGHIGALRKQKNHRFLLQIFKEVQKQEPQAKLILVGEGELEEEIKNQIIELGVEKNVILTGKVRKPERYYQMFDIFLLPSLFEGLPFVGVEAQASGTRCLFSDRIDSAVNITPLVSFYDIDKPAKEWADLLLDYKDTLKKADYEEEIEMAGYGIRKLGEYYNTLFDKIVKE